MKIRVLALLFLFIFCSFAFGGLGKLGPRLGIMATYPQSVSDNQPALFKGASGERFVQVIVTHDDGLDDIRRLGGRIIVARGTMAAAAVPISQLQALSDLPSVIYVESPLPASAQLDKSTVAIQARKAQSQRGVSGRNVIIGIIDSGIDFYHQDFRKANGMTRIKYILDLSDSGPVYGGMVYDEQDINDALNGIGEIPQTDPSGHGTHVAGIAAGDGSDTDAYGMYAGVAPAADLVIVKATRDVSGDQFLSVDQVSALAFIDSVAEVLGEPYVANLSLGGHNGAHDGTSVMERFIDSIVGPGKPGKVVVTVAGNDGEADVHARTSFSNGQKESITFNVQQYVPQAGRNNDMIVLDGWYSGTASIGITLVTPSGTRVGPVLPSGIADEQTDDGAVYIWNGYYENGGSYQNGVNPFNGDREFYIQITDEELSRRPAVGEWTIQLSGSGSTVDVWIASASMDVEFVKGAVADGKLSIPGTARNAITAAAFISKKNWYDLDGNHLTFDADGIYEKGDIAAFSSPGPVRKNSYQKPDIAAPGQIVVSTYSSQAPPSHSSSIFAQSDPRYPNALINEDGEHGLSSGTSMAAPHVAGAAALLLEMNPGLTCEQIKQMMIESAKSDQYVGQVPNDQWGWGKLDVYSALQITPGEETPTGLLFAEPAPNPFLNQTRIEYALPLIEGEEKVAIIVYNAIGQQVRTLVDKRENVGSHVVYWDGRDDSGAAVGSGIYFIKMKFGISKIVHKVVFLSRNK